MLDICYYFCPKGGSQNKTYPSYIADDAISLMKSKYWDCDKLEDYSWATPFINSCVITNNEHSYLLEKKRQIVQLKLVFNYWASYSKVKKYDHQRVVSTYTGNNFVMSLQWARSFPVPE